MKNEKDEFGVINLVGQINQSRQPTNGIENDLRIKINNSFSPKPDIHKKMFPVEKMPEAKPAYLDFDNLEKEIEYLQDNLCRAFQIPRHLLFGPDDVIENEDDFAITDEITDPLNQWMTQKQALEAFQISGRSLRRYTQQNIFNKHSVRKNGNLTIYVKAVKSHPFFSKVDSPWAKYYEAERKEESLQPDKLPLNNNTKPLKERLPQDMYIDIITMTLPLLESDPDNKLSKIRNIIKEILY
jgi:hypothetical protein